MRPNVPLPLAALLAVAVLAPVADAAVVNAPQFDPETMMRVSEVERGMTGYGLTVFQGVEVTRFDVEVLGVLSKANLGEDLILIEVTSGPVVERESGIIGGMSGSPIFIDGRLIGAIAYGWSFLREPIGGVTCIESMLDSWMGGQQPQAALPPDHELRGARLAGRWVEQARIDASGPAFHDERTINLRPVSPIVSVAGMGESGMSRLNELLAPHGLEAMPGPGRLAEDVPVELQPGAGVGVTLMEGDFDVSVIGTLTWREGDRILAFGHPMMQIGAVELPMTTAWVHGFLPSISRSNKLSSPMATVGALTEDGAWSIAGTVGGEAPMVPGHFTVTDEDRGMTRSFDVRVAQQELLTPGLMMSGLSSALEATFYPGSDGIGTIDFELRGDGGAVIRRRDIIWHPGFLGPVTSWVDEAMYYLTENRFEQQQVAALDATVTLSSGAQPAAIERVYTDEHVARAGEQLTVHVVIRPENGEVFEKVVRFDLPEDLPKGSMRVGAAAGDEEFSLKSYLRLLMPQIDSLADLSELIETMKRANQLYVAVALPQPTVGMEGTELPRLPMSAVMALSADEASDLTAGYAELSETFASEHYLVGYQVARLPTENRMGERGKVKPSESESEEYTTSYAALASELPHTWWAATALAAGARPLQEGDLPTQELAPGDEPGLVNEVTDDEEEAVDEEEEEPEEDGGEHPEPDGEALSRGLSSFAHTTADDFEDGRTEGTMVRSDGAVMLAPHSEIIATAQEPVIWSLAADGDGVWFGTANPGRVYRWRPGGEAEVVCDTGSLLVLSLLPTGDGGVLAGTGPDGCVLRIGADGAVAVAHELPVRYVWALARDASGAVVAGTGPDGRIYRLGDEAELAATISQPHALDFALDGERLYVAGGDDQATVFEVLPGGRVREVFGTDDQGCTGVAVLNGRLVVTTAMSGKIYLVDPDGHGREVYSSDEEVMHQVACAEGWAWAGTADDGKLVGFDGAEDTAVALQDEVSEQIVRVAAGDGVIYAASAGPARMWRIDLRAATEGTYRSAALDAKRLSRWARMVWDASVPDGASLTVDARSGNNQVPDDGSWSAWTAALGASGEVVPAPPGRYAQYRLRLAGSWAGGPEVRRLALLYLPRNRRPELKVSEPAAGDALRGDEFKLSWEADDDDDDTLVATLFSRAEGAEEWTLVATVEDETSYTWDTTDVADGHYTLKLVLSDEPSNPIGAERDEAIIEDITIDNTYPTLTLLSTPRRDEEPALVHGLAGDELCRITSIDWTFAGDERWRAAPPDDGMLDSMRELFTISLPEIPEDETGIKIRLRDAAGNVTVEDVVLLDQRPPGGEAPPPEVEGAQEAG